MNQKNMEAAINTYYKDMYRLSLSYVKNKDDAMDVVQDSAYKAMVRCRSLKDPGKVRSWLFSITVNTALDLIKANKRIVPLELDENQGRDDKYHDIDLLACLDELDINERKIIMLHFFEECTTAETAEILNINENTVKTIMYRSMKKLRKRLSEGGGFDAEVR
ncbi:MAG: RNA polymerase sigma factor [Lachnospiraceae bacterium]|jgi:RNA polymerase sigma-70 factor (ECF subfamily)|nr:RNA polymerase sigma factor [Lachnospiraceae bacterium]MEE3460640.1 RNA polymerase sigma factor [Lachnospiraceae bacterium]